MKQLVELRAKGKDDLAASKRFRLYEEPTPIVSTSQ